MSICIFGDSITWEGSDLEKGGWAERLKLYISERYDIEVYNLGVSGKTLIYFSSGQNRQN